ncbi:MAG: outer membrane beta-barrel family protein [Sediminibacterium sp.]|nr:outer membrane beta-barrel family protein [Sediminibacterium sp.]
MRILFITAIIFVSVKGWGQIKTTSDTLQLNGQSSITVVSAKPFIQTLVDKTVMNVAGRTGVNGQNALELLKLAPGVVVDPNEQIKMGGKDGVTVLIDDRNTQLSAQDLAQLLKSIEVDNIKEIEIITNPSAKFDAAGNAGIINIKLKKSITNGFNGSVTGSYTQSTHARGSATTSLNFRKNKWNWFSNTSLNKGYQVTIANNTRNTPNNQFIQRGNEIDDFNSNNTRVGLDYAMNKKTTIGILWMSNSRNTNMDNSNTTNVSQLLHPDTTVLSRSIAPFFTDRNNLNLNYKYNLDEKRELNVDADYTGFRSTLNNTVYTQSQTQLAQKFGEINTRNNAVVDIVIGSIKVDYKQTINANSSFETGLKSVLTIANNSLIVSNQIGNIIAVDTGKTNQFNFNEHIQAAYFSYRHNFKKFSLQTGLRGEYTSVNGTSVDLKNNLINKPDTNYLNLFPTLFLQYNLNETNQLGLSMSRRIDRPSYQDQNPFIYVLDAFNSEQGNPYLIPQFTNSVELSYTYKYATSFKIQLAKTDGYIELLTYQVGNKTILIPQNVGSRKVINFSFSTPFAPKKWWDIYVSATPFYQQYTTKLSGFDTNEQIQQQSWGFNGYLSNTFSFQHNWKLDLSGWFNFQNTTTIYQSKPLGSVNIGLSKRMFKDQSTFKMTINDVFNTQRWEQTALTRNVNMQTYRKWESRNISISMSFRFGNNKIKSSRERETGANDEIGRIKSNN